MNTMEPLFTLQSLCFFLFLGVYRSQAWSNHYKFVIEETTYTRLCTTKKILTVNGQYPGPPLHVRKGDTIFVDVYNKGDYNITLHWHGVRMPRNPWSDGPEYITQCPIQPGKKFRQKVIFSDEEGTLWWHAHSDYTRATVHGPIIVSPAVGTTFPFPNKPHAQIPIILGEWWKQDIMQLYLAVRAGGGGNISDALTINGQPGDFYPCSKQGTFRITVDYGKTYLLRIINAGMSELMFFAVANHTLTVVGSDASYVKRFNSTYITISPGQTIDLLLEANQKPDHYYMAAIQYNGASNIMNTGNATAILQYSGNYTPSSPPNFPDLPNAKNTTASIGFTSRLRCLGDKRHRPIVGPPPKPDHSLFYVISLNTFPCGNNETCQGPNSSRLAASINNISFQNPDVDILQAYYYGVNGVFRTGFPGSPPRVYNFTGSDIPSFVMTPWRGTKVRVLEYGSKVEIVFQGTNVLGGSEHPMHLHGFSFYVVGMGLGNFDKKKDPQSYNFVDPPLMNTIAVPVNGWVAIRFRADNPGVWFMHCHFDRHNVWGMDSAFIVKNGKSPAEHIMPPPSDMPQC